MVDVLEMPAEVRGLGVTPEYVEAVGADESQPGRMGFAEPRLFTPPLRPLTPETSLGFEVIAFATMILGVTLYPWQKALLIRALELRPDGRYRYRRVLVLVGRQNGKTMLASVLAAWWLFVDSGRHPDRVPPFKFRVVGVAQALAIAREPWNAVKQWCDPDPESAEEADLARPTLQAATSKVLDSNGKEGIYTRQRPHYEIRAAANARGTSSARVLFDELREQKTWAAWNAVSHTTKSFFNGQLWGISNAGDATAVVLNTLRATLLEQIESWTEYVESGTQALEDFANGVDTTTGLFEWSAREGLPVDDVEGLLQSNPSTGYGEATIEDLLAEVRSGVPEAELRTEVLCQSVPSRVTPHLDGAAWSELEDPESSIPATERKVLGVVVQGNRQWTSIGVAGLRADGLTHLEVIAGREGMVWVVDYCKQVRRKTGIDEIAIQTKGVPSAELVEPLREAGFVIHAMEGVAVQNAAGRMKDRVDQAQVRHQGHPRLDFAATNGTVRFLSKMPVWDLFDSPVDVSPIASVTDALYALETTERPKPKPKRIAPPAPAVLKRTDGERSESNVLTTHF